MSTTEASAATNSSKNRALKRATFSRNQLIIFAIVFAAIGGYVLYKSFAASAPIASLEGEQMSQAIGSKIVTDSTASGGKALELVSSTNTTTGSPTAKPAIPTGLKATIANGSVSLSWAANPAGDQVDAYQVYYGTVASFSSFNGYVPSVTGTNYTVSGLTNGKTYYFRVSAHNSVGYGPWSAASVGATPTKPKTTVPTAKPAIPSGLKATAASGSVTLSWNANPVGDQVSAYQVYYAPNSSFTNFNGYIPSVTGTTYTVTGLTNGTTYYFRVSARNAVGYGPWSASPVSAVPAAIPAVAAVPAATSVNSATTTTGSVNFPSSVTSLTVNAKGDQCNGAPQMSVAVDGSTLINAASVTNTSWSGYSANASLSSGTHSLSITFNNPLVTSTCARDLYIDVTNFYGPAPVTTPAPTVTLSATPPSITAGSSSTLTWSSTNATSCSASGAWSGTENTSGSTTTGALNLSSTYTLTCTGAGGSANKSATVTVTAASSSSSSSGGGVSSGFVPHAMYDSDGTQPNFTADWPGIAATGVNTLILPADWTSNLQTLAAAGDKAWVTAGYWSDSSHSFSETQSQAVSYVTSACATGAVQGIYVADEPDETLGSAPAADIAAVKARAAALKAVCPNAVTIMAYYDYTSIAEWKGVTDYIALDGYPSRDGFNNSVITNQAGAADAAGIKYYGVVGAFTDGTSNYPLPTAAQLSSMFSTWEGTHESGWAVYSWGAAGGASSTQLQNQPSLLSIIKSNAAL